MDDLNIGIEDNGAEKTLRELTSAVNELRQAFQAFAASPVANLAKEIEKIGSSSTRMAAEVKSGLSKVGEEARKAGRSAGEAYAKGVGEGAAGSSEKVKKAFMSVDSDLDEAGSRTASAAREVRRRLSASQRELAGSYNALGMFISTEQAKLTKLAEEASARASDDAVKALSAGAGGVGQGVDKVKRSLAGSYNSLGVFISNEQAKLSKLAEDSARQAEASASRALSVGAYAVGSGVSAVKRELAGSYNSLGVFISNEQAKLSKLVGGVPKSLAVGANSVGSGPQVAKRAQAGTYNSLGLFIPNTTEGVAEKTVEGAGKVAKALDTVKVSSHELHSALRGVASGFNAMWLTWGNVAPMLAGAALSNAFVQSVRKGAEFQSTLTGITALAGESAESVQEIQREALKLGSTGPYGPLEMAEAFKTLALAGVSAKDQLESIGAVRNFAIVGETDIKSAAQGLVAIATAYGYGAKNFEEVADVVAKTAASSMASVQDMTEAFRQASVVAQQYGVSLEDTSTNLALLSQIGITGSAAGTAMRNMYTELMGSSKKARAVLKDTLKIDVWDNAAKAMKPLPEIMEDMAEALARMNPKAQQQALADLGNERGTKTLAANLAALEKKFKETGETSASAFDSIRDKIAKAPGYAAVAAATMGGSTLNQIKGVGASLESALVKSFERSEPAIQALATQLKSIFGSQEFQQDLSNLAGSVANLLRLFVDNAGALMALAKVYVVYKGAVVAAELATVALGAATALTATVSNAWMGLTQVSRGAALAFQSGAVASTALAASVGAVGPAASASSVGVRLLVSSLGPIAAVLAAAGLAWTFFSERSQSGADQAAESALTAKAGYDSLMTSVDEQIKRLDKLAQAREKNLTGAAAAAAVERSLAEDTIKNYHKKQSALLDLEEQELRTAAASWKKWENVPGMSILAGDANIGLQSGLKDIAERRLDLAISEGLALSSVAELQRKATEEAGKAAQASKDAMRNRRSGTESYDPDAYESRGAGFGSLPKDNEIQQLEKRLNQELQRIEDFTSKRKTILDNARQAEALSQGQFAALEVLATVAAETRALEAIESHTPEILKAYADRASKISAEMAKVRSGKGAAEQKDQAVKRLEADLENLNREKTTFEESIEAKREKVETSALVRIEKIKAEAVGAVNRLKDEEREYLKGEDRRMEDLRERTQFEASLTGMAESRVAVLRAEYEERKRLLDMDRQLTDEIQKRERELEDFKATAYAGPLLPAEQAVADSQVASKQSAIDQLNARLGGRRATYDTKIEDAGLEAASAKLAQMANIDLASVFDKAAVSIDGMKVNLGALANQMVEVAAHEGVYAKLQAQAKKEGKSTADLDKQIARSRINDGAAMIGMVKSYAKEGTKTYKALQTAEQVYHAAQIAMGMEALVAKLGFKATETAASVTAAEVEMYLSEEVTAADVANSAVRAAASGMAALAQSLTAPFPTNLAAFATVAGLLAAIGVATGALGGTSGSFAATNEGTGTVLGDVKDSDGKYSQKSESISNSVKLLESLNTLSGVQLEYTRQMAASLRNLEGQIGGVAALTSRNGVVGLASQGVSAGFRQSALGGVLENGSRAVMGAVTLGLSELTGLGPAISKVIGKGFGTSTKIKGQGLMADDQSLGSVLNGGLNLDSYADVQKKKKSFYVTTKTTNSTERARADSETSGQFTGMIRTLAETVAQAAGPILGDANGAMNQLKNYTVSIGKIKLDGLSGEQIQEKLNAVFSAEGDKMAKFVAGGLSEMQLVGEGMYETLVRVSSNLVTVNDTFKTLGYSVQAMGVEGAKWAVSLTDAFGGLDKFQSSMSKYYEAFYTEEERTATTTQRLTKALQDLGVGALPKSVSEYRKMVDAFVAGNDMSSEAAQQTYAQLIMLSEPFAEITKSTEELRKELIQSSTDILDYVNKLKGERGGLATPAEKLAAARNQYVSDLSSAKSGNAEAMKNVSKSADDYIQAQKGVTASSGYTQAVIDQIIAELTSLGQATKTGVPAFASGGYHAGGWAMVGEEGPELAYFDSPARIYNAKQTSAMGDNSELVAEVRSLREEVSKLRAQQSQETGALINSNLSAQQRAADRVVDGMSEAAERTAYVQQTTPALR